MISKELAKKIRYIQIYTSKAVNDILAGEYESVFKGRGMEFDEVREYQPGDEVRTIDWNVTARTGRPYVKRFVEERELTVLFLVDLSASGKFGSGEKNKNETAAELCALLAFAAIKNNDKTGLVLFSDEVKKFIPPQKGTTHVLKIIRELLSFDDTANPKADDKKEKWWKKFSVRTPEKENPLSQTNIAGAIDYIGRVIKKKAVVFLVSDFQGSDFEKSMRVAAKRHDLIAVSITDPREIEFPDVGLMDLEDAETGEQVTIDTNSIAVRNHYKSLNLSRMNFLRELFASIGIDHIEIHIQKNYIRDLMMFFMARERKQIRKSK